MGNTRDTGYLRNLLSLSESGKLTEIKVGDKTFTEEKILDFNLTIAPEVLEIQVDAPQASQDTAWLWTWLTSSLPYARTTITNSPQLSVPLYRKGAYVVNNFAANDLHGSMTQVHKLYLKWIDGAGTANNVSWATSVASVASTHPDINGGTSTNVQRITVNVPENISLPTLVAPQVSYNVSFITPGSYHFGGSAYGDNPNIGPFYRGGTYTFNLDASLASHPFYLTTDNGANFATGTYFGEYTNGVTGSRNTSGTLVFTVPQNAPDTLYYQCGVHGSMRGVISVKNLAVETNNNGNYIVYFQHDQEGHKTPVELRPIPSLVNQMCLVYDATAGKFVPQDLATYVENTPSFKNKIQEVAGTATLIAPDGIPVVASVIIVEDGSYLPLVGNKLGDIAYSQDTNTLYIWNGSVWDSTKPANTNELAEGSTNKYYTDARVGSYLTTNNYATQSYVGTQVANLVSSAPSTLDTLNELAAALGNDPNFATSVTTSIATKVPQARTISINGTSYDLSSDRSWTIAAGLTSFNTRTGDITLTSADVTTALGYTPYNSTNPSGYTTNTGTVTSVAALTLGTTGTDLSSTVATGTTTPVITLNVPTASAANRGVLSSADWTTFNNKQAAINGTGFVKAAGTTISYDNSTYLTASTVLSTAITGYAVGTNTALAATDTILGAFNKIQGQINAKGTGTVTSVGGTGTVSGLTLTGTVTASGNLTLGGTLSLTSGNVTTALGYTPYNSTNPSGYITSGGRAYPRRSDGGDLNFYWSGQSGQPPWLWGGSDGANMYVYNPSNFSVSYSNTSGATNAVNVVYTNSSTTVTAGNGVFYPIPQGLLSAGVTYLISVQIYAGGRYASFCFPWRMITGATQSYGASTMSTATYLSQNQNAMGAYVWSDTNGQIGVQTSGFDFYNAPSWSVEVRKV